MDTQADMLDGLNAAQRRGVEHEGSPLIVLAGPGTGKTRLITRRVAHLIESRGVDPSSIVATTFTNKAAEELRQRLARLVGIGPAERVHAGTFHALGLGLLRRFGGDLGAAPEIIDSAQRRRLVRSLAAEHGVYGSMIALGSEALLEEAAAVIGLCRDNAVTPGRALSFARAWAERLEAGRGSDGSALDAEALEAERHEQARFEAHARLYGLFEDGCRRRGWLTMDELITLPAQALAESDRARALCRAELRHFVVDEFQDMNLAQIELLRALAPPETDPDLVVVGDDDQAIYEFRGADDRAFARFASIWTNTDTLALTENYRSSRPVLDVANAVISRASDRFAPEKRVERAASLADDPEGAGVEIVLLEEDSQAGEAIAAMVKAELNARPEAPLSRVAVIARTNSELDGIGEALELEGVPTQRHRDRSTADDPGVADLLAWVHLLVDPSAHWAVRRALGRPPFGVDAETLSRLERAYLAARRLAMLGEDGGESRGFGAWLADHGADSPALPRFLALRAELLEASATAPASEVIWTIATRLDLAHADMLGARDRAARVANLVRVIRFARGVQHRLDPPGDLPAFWSYYNDLDSRDREFREIGEGAVHTDDEGERAERNAVQLHTAHGAKGLEFDVVFVPRVNPPHGFPKTSGGQSGPALPEGLIDRLGDERSAKERSRAEERRVFYVAATRAERRLVLTTRKTKTRSSSEHYAQELLYDEAGLVAARGLDEVLEHSARNALTGEAPPGAAREQRRRAGERERREARALAASAMDEAERPGADERAVERAVGLFREAAERAAVAAAMEAGRPAPAWVRTAGAGEVASRLEAMFAGDAEDEAPRRFRALTPPISLSYTLIDRYLRCPACFYVTDVLGLGEPPTAHLTLGGLVHQALEWHARAWRDAEAEGREPPTPEALEAHTRSLFARMVRSGGEGDTLARDETVAMVLRAHEMMAACGAEILEIERKITVPYAVDDQEHRLVAKLDRVDRTGAGVRIVDYKTGRSTEARRSPNPTDLQLGIYAMAIRHEMPEVAGEAEYWLLRTGERGSIALDKINEQKVRQKIDGVVRGLTAGEFPRAPRTCAGLCELIGA